MGLLELVRLKPRVRPNSDLSTVATDRLLREYARYAGAGAALREISERAESSSGRVDIRELEIAVDGIVMRAKIFTELEERGVIPPA